MRLNRFLQKLDSYLQKGFLQKGELKMENQNTNTRSFLINGLGYLAGAVVGFLFIYLFGALGLAGWLFSLVDEEQTFLQILAVPLIALFVLALGGAITGVIGGWVAANSIGTERKGKLAAGSGVAFAATTSLLLLVFLLLIGFIALYNNFTSERIEQYGILFGLFGLVFGLLTGLLQAFTTVRLRHTWRVILLSTVGFALGGVITGLIVRLINPTDGLKTFPILTTIILLIALLLPYFFGGGALGLAYRQIAKRTAQAGEAVEIAQSPRWQIVVVGVLALFIIVPVFNLVDNISNFLTIRPANLQSQISPVTVGVRWGEPLPVSASILDVELPTSSTETALAVSADGSEHQAWCSPGGSIQYQLGDGPTEQIDFPSCSSTPAIVLDQDGIPHIVWYTQEVRNSTGATSPASLLVESIRRNGEWSEAAIAARTDGEALPALSLDTEDNLILVWEDAADTSGNVYLSIQENYECSEDDLSSVELAGIEAILGGDTRPPGTEIPYCRNEFDRIIYTPNPEAEYSDQQITQNGGFDQVSALIEEAEYEVLFNVMQYVETNAEPSPGRILAESVGKLYQEVKSNPEDYPRGMTVRILLGNYPIISNFTWGDQIIEVIKDLKWAGVEKMVDPEIGWRVEVANYPGVYPHSHNKMFVVDGKLAGGLGFNYNYIHFTKDHPSGGGDDLFDLGMTVRGPVAQDAITHYDDMWNGANQVHCEDLTLPDGQWQDTCQEVKATNDHVPEVLRAYLPMEGDTNAFSLYRSKVFGEADDFIAASLAASTESIELITANFSLDLYCMINLLAPGFCTLNDSMPYIDAILEAVEKNQTHVRVIMENANTYGLENRVTAMVIYPELAKRGLEDLVELRFFNGRTHSKSGLIDDALLIIGSQNFQYSAWGKGGGLGENMITTSDPEAIAEFKALFETKWQEAVPVDEAEYGTVSK
jgi:phosphatidylserine/phosphatidylglycerophosphate/cardiolipin synthase-like enzyme